MPTCHSCKKYLPGGGACPRCTGSATQVGSTRAFATQLRAQTTRAPHAPATGSSAGGFWGTVAGQVRREQETWTGRARGTTTLTVLALMAPIVAGILTGSTTASDTAGGMIAMLAFLMLPLAFLIILMSLGRGGPLSFMGRLAGNTVNMGMGLASQRRPRRGGPGRILIVEHGTQQSRVEVARPLDVPIGSSVTVHGPRIAGYRHAWFVRVHGLDNHALPARGVLLACASVALGGLLTVLTLIAGIGEVVG